MSHSPLLADPTGFEPAVSGVTGRRVRPLHYGSLPTNQAIGTARRTIPQPQPGCQHSIALVSGQRIRFSRLWSQDTVISTAHCVTALVGMLEERQHVFARRRQQITRIGYRQ